MILVTCLWECKTELICDLAEVYGIHNWRQYPPDHIATLTAGLGENSRTRRKIAGINTSLTDLLLALIADRINDYIYGMANQEPPGPSISSVLLGKAEEPEREFTVFSSGDDFINKYKQLGGQNYG